MPSTAPAAAAAAAPAAVAAASAATASTASTALAASPPPKIEVKVSWLKQKPVAGNRQPVLEFDEQQLHAFPPETTTFRQVKHECSYPAPPHKVRMWCSSFGAAADLPTTMELNVFINTFELITEEKHTLSMAHLTGGETIAFEMVQGEHVSELSGFLLGDHVGRAKKGQGGAASGQAQLVLPGGVNAPAGILQPLAQARAASELKQKELIAEEEEEKAKREKKKAKKKGKKDKQREKKKALREGRAAGGGGAASLHTSSCEQALAGEPPAAKAAGGSEEEEEDTSEEEQPAASSSSASVPAASGAGGSSAGGSRSGGSGSAGGASSSAAAQGGRAVGAGSPSGGEAGAGGGAVESEADYEGLSEEQLRAQVLKSHQLIRALVEQCLLERRSKEALAVQMADYEAAAAAQHSEYAADVAHLRAQLAKARAQSIN